MSQLIEAPVTWADHICEAYREATGKWTGCDWPTVFGQTGLDLKGMKASQTRLMAIATSGRESADWYAATEWLKVLEEEAREAERHGQEAVALAEVGDVQGAFVHARQACAIERKYHLLLVWRPLAETTERAFGEPLRSSGCCPRDRVRDLKETNHAPTHF